MKPTTEGCQQWVFNVLESLLNDGIITDHDRGETKHKLEMIFIEGDESDQCVIPFCLELKL